MIWTGSAAEIKALSGRQIDQIRAHLEELTTSTVFSGSRRACSFLDHVVLKSLTGDFESLRERAIGAELFGRSIDYDTGNDSIVRVKAIEVRRRLAQYYNASAGHPPSVRIDLPSGSYVPRFSFIEQIPEKTPEPILAPESPQQIEPSPVEKLGPDSAIPLDALRPPDGLETVETSLLGHVGRVFRRKRSLLFVATGVLITLIAASAIYLIRRHAATLSHPIRSIVVLPFKNPAADSTVEHFSSRMTRTLISDLEQVGGLHILSPSSVMEGKRTDELGFSRSLVADQMLEGSVLRDGERLKININLVDVKTGNALWSGVYIRDASNDTSVSDDLAQAAAEAVRITIAPELQRTEPARPVSTKAEDAYMRGMVSMNARDYDAAFRDFQEAIAIYPDFASAHVAMAYLYSWGSGTGLFPETEMLPKAEQEALKAIQLDPTLPEAHAVYGITAMNADWDWETGRKELRRALELNPRSAVFREDYADLLERTGNTQQAISEMNYAFNLDPDTERTYYDSAAIYYYAHQFDKALDMAKRAKTMQKENTSVLDLKSPRKIEVNEGGVLNENNATGGSFILGAIYVEKGLYAKGIDEFSRLTSSSPHHLGRLGNAYARNGNIAGAQAIITRLKGSAKSDGAAAYDIAIVYVGLGDKDEAFRWLQTAYQAHNVYYLTYIKVDPCLDPLRGDARFRSLEQSIGLN